MKDETLIPHFIETEFVYFKQTEIRVTVDEIKRLKGKQVYIVIKGKYFRAEVDAEPYQKSIKTQKNFENFEKKEADNTFFSSPPLISNISNSLPKVEYAPEFAKRIKIQETQWFMSELNNINISFGGAVLQGILETVFRFPQLNTTEIMKKNLYRGMNYYDLQSYNEVVDYTLNSGNYKGEISALDQMINIFLQNNIFFGLMASYLFSEPEDFYKICSDYDVCIQVYYIENSVILNKIFTPLKPFSELPLISFVKNVNLYLVYSENMMEFDRYDIENPSFMKDSLVNHCQNPFIYRYQPFEPKYEKLFVSVNKTLQFFTSQAPKNNQSFVSIKNELIEALSSLNEKLVNENYFSIMNDILNIKILEEKQPLLCKCKKNPPFGDFFCSNCENLCLACVLFSNVFNTCPNCCTVQNVFDVESVETECARCRKTTNGKSLGVFSCKCVYCISCFYSVFYAKVNLRCFCEYELAEFDLESNHTYFYRIR